ncbi:hypothetical protein [Bradyrhizobium sp. Leo121]|uniref:hypothetical protein n=1 Tax=Bradyrhizobium sp. Leo121 TaxID=1571195 RepID=UPI0010299C1C|nr:hypothetical protein [Bradyrhizobium sp. Leo121]
MVVAETIAGLSSLKTAFDMTRALANMHETTVRDRAIIELQREILDGLSAQSELLKTVSSLEAEVARLKAWDADKERYQLCEIAPGVTAYSLKEGVENGDPKHYLCPSCYLGAFKSILQPQIWNPGRCNVLVCHDCGWHAYLSGASSPEHKNLKPKPYRGA